jgi:hypothetical protein
MEIAQDVNTHARILLQLSSVSSSKRGREILSTSTLALRPARPQRNEVPATASTGALPAVCHFGGENFDAGLRGLQLPRTRMKGAWSVGRDAASMQSLTQLLWFVALAREQPDVHRAGILA